MAGEIFGTGIAGEKGLGLGLRGAFFFGFLGLMEPAGPTGYVEEV